MQTEDLEDINKNLQLHKTHLQNLPCKMIISVIKKLLSLKPNVTLRWKAGRMLRVSYATVL